MNRNDYSLIPDYTLTAIQNYVDKRWEPGHFLTAVLCNNLRMAIAAADDNNIKVIPQIVCYLYNEVPGSCWGSLEKVEAWLKGD